MSGIVAEVLVVDYALDADECEAIELWHRGRYVAPLTPAERSRAWLLTLRSRVRRARRSDDWARPLPLP